MAAKTAKQEEAMARLAAALDLPEGERKQAAAVVLRELLWPWFEHTWPPPVPPLPGLEAGEFGRAVYWASFYFGHARGLRDVGLPRARRRAAAGQAAAAGAPLASALFAAHTARPGDTRKPDGVARDLGRCLMARFLGSKGLKETRTRAENLTAGRVQDGKLKSTKALPAFTTACDAVVLGEAVAQLGLAAIEGTGPADAARASATVYACEMLLAYCPGLEAVDGIAEAAMDEAGRLVVPQAQGAQFILPGRELLTSLGRLSDAVEAARTEADREIARGDGGEMRTFRTYLNILSEYKKYLQHLP